MYCTLTQQTDKYIYLHLLNKHLSLIWQSFQRCENEEERQEEKKRRGEWGKGREVGGGEEAARHVREFCECLKTTCTSPGWKLGLLAMLTDDFLVEIKPFFSSSPGGAERQGWFVWREFQAEQRPSWGRGIVWIVWITRLVQMHYAYTARLSAIITSLFPLASSPSSQRKLHLQA